MAKYESSMTPNISGDALEGLWMMKLQFPGTGLTDDESKKIDAAEEWIYKAMRVMRRPKHWDETGPIMMDDGTGNMVER